MKIAIYGRTVTDALIPSVEMLMEELIAHNVEVTVYRPFYKFLDNHLSLDGHLSTFEKKDSITQGLDFLFCLGGDGTMLDAVTVIRDSGVPILGINTGRLGFLASTQVDHLKHAVKAVVSKRYSIDSRTLLTVDTKNKEFGKTNFALNELTVLKQDSSSMITIKTYLYDEFMNSYWADGLIIATPTGSTAYSLSCGGPIISPDSQNLVITPIAPHNLNVRPVIVPDDNEITLEVQSRGGQFLAAIDSRSTLLPNNTELTIKKARFKVNLLQLEDESFLKTLRTKLMWGLDQRN